MAKEDPIKDTSNDETTVGQTDKAMTAAIESLILSNKKATSSKKAAKEMSEYKFWKTQPVPKLDDEPVGDIEEGPFNKVMDLAQVAKVPSPLIDGFEWVTMDLLKDQEIDEVFELLSGHYVEDDEAMFRFNYSREFLKWALLAPGYQNEWHVGIRATTSRRLVAFISAIPVSIRVRNTTFKASEVNFLCIHKKLRGKRLAPVLIKEVTRRSHLKEVWQGIYTSGTFLPTPISTARYFHRALDWQKLYEIGFSHLPSNSKPQWQLWKYSLPGQTSIKGLRPMEKKDVEQVLDLATKYLAKFDMAPTFEKEELEYWFLPSRPKSEKKFIWTYVVEDPSSKTVTDFFSFYSIESSVIGHPRHTSVRAAYLFYYATSTSLGLNDSSNKELANRLNALMTDALILAKKEKFDVFNALSLMDNPLFLEKQKFGPGTNQLHFYLYNYRAKPISGGVDADNKLNEECGGLGLVMR